jgi:hypothetical protein
MVKILAFVVAAVALMTAPPFTPAKAQSIKMAQVDMQGRHFDDRDPSSYYGERRRRYECQRALSKLFLHTRSIQEMVGSVLRAGAG